MGLILLHLQTLIMRIKLKISNDDENATHTEINVCLGEIRLNNDCDFPTALTTIREK